MPTGLVTGSGGLIGSEAVKHFVEAGYDVIGIENNMREQFFGPEASTSQTTKRLLETHPEFRSVDLDIRDADGVRRLFEANRDRLEFIIHTAAQPSHDWAASDPHTDFSVNAVGTLNLLESARQVRPDATFVFMSTNKVYGDRPNFLPLEEEKDRLELPISHPYYGGIDTSMSIDGCLHSLFGVSKASADLMVQEYWRYFDMPTVCFHGFLAYLMKCTVSGTPYTVFGYDGKQVRDNIHSNDVVSAMEAFHRSPRAAAVYNLGGGRDASCSMREAIELCERIAGRALDWTLSDQARVGDHRWWISDLTQFKSDYPDWRLTRDLEATLREIHDANADEWLAAVS
jgi:CDP-paratose 2-epimerase